MVPGTYEGLYKYLINKFTKGLKLSFSIHLTLFLPIILGLFIKQFPLCHLLFLGQLHLPTTLCKTGESEHG